MPSTAPAPRDDRGMSARSVPTPLAVQLLRVADCPHAAVADVRLRVALNATGHEDTPIEWVLVNSPEQADELHFYGSPTVLLDGHDPFATPDQPVGLACRLYASDTGTTGAPSLAELVDAILLAQTPVEPGPTVEA